MSILRKIPLPFATLLFALLIGVLSFPRAKKLDSPDFKVFYTATQYAIHEPEMMYQKSPDRYLYPPQATVFFLPFGFSTHYSVHQWQWHLFLVACLWFLVRSSWAKIFSMLLLTRYLLITFGYGQVNLVLLAGLSLLATNLSSRWKGFVWASVSVIKIYPLVFGLGFLLQKAKAVLLSAMISLFLFSLIPLFYLWKSPFFLYEEFLRSLESKGFPLHSHNQSISALLQRAFTDQEFPLHAVGVEKWAFLQLDIGFVKIIAFLLGLLLSAGIWWLAFKKNKEKHNFEYYLAAGSFSVLFLSHIVWKDYLLFLFFPLAQIFKDQTPKHLKALAVLSLLFVTLFSSPDVMGAPLGTRLDAACIHLWGALFIALIWAKTLMRIDSR